MRVRSNDHPYTKSLISKVQELLPAVLRYGWLDLGGVAGEVPEGAGDEN